MNDLISRQQAIDALKEALNPSVAYFVKAKMAIEALPPSPSRPHDISKAKFSCPICGAEMEATVDEWDDVGAV